MINSKQDKLKAEIERLEKQANTQVTDFNIFGALNNYGISEFIEKYQSANNNQAKQEISHLKNANHHLNEINDDLSNTIIFLREKLAKYESDDLENTYKTVIKEGEMSKFNVGDLVFDRLLEDVVVYDESYEHMSESHKDMVLRHATPNEIEKLKQKSKLLPKEDKQS